jgi:hypothetical protein
MLGHLPFCRHREQIALPAGGFAAGGRERGHGCLHRSQRCPTVGTAAGDEGGLPRRRMSGAAA